MLLFILFYFIFCPAPLSGFSYGWQNALPYLPLVNGELQEGINVSQNAPGFWNQSQPPLEWNYCNLSLEVLELKLWLVRGNMLFQLDYFWRVGKKRKKNHSEKVTVKTRTVLFSLLLLLLFFWRTATFIYHTQNILNIDSRLSYCMLEIRKLIQAARPVPCGRYCSIST